jgi:hypothetical protein
MNARAAVIAYEPFAGTTPGAPIVGLNSGTGFFSGWGQGGFNVGQSANFTYAADSLRYFTLPVSGGRMNSVAVSGLISGVQRFFVTPIGQAGTTVYLSVLLRPEGTLNNGEYNGFFGVYLNTGTELFIGKPGGDAIGEYVIENRGGSSQQSTQEPVTVGATAFLVLKAEFGEVGDVFTLYVTPPPVPVEPLTGVVKTDHALRARSGPSNWGRRRLTAPFPTTFTPPLTIPPRCSTRAPGCR